MAGRTGTGRPHGDDGAGRSGADQLRRRGGVLRHGRLVVLVAILALATGCPRKSKPAPAPEPAAPPIAEAPLPPSGTPQFEIGDLDWKRSDDARELFVEGTVRNTGTRPSRDIKVWVDGLDASGIRLARTEALPTPQEIPPGGVGRFLVRMPNDPGIRTFHVEAIGR